MGHFYFVRHGESLWNVENKICGATDIDLTEKGFQQAEQAAESILHQELKIDMILASPLKRAYHTAQVISERTGIPLKAEPRLIEQNFGKWEGFQNRQNPFHRILGRRRKHAQNSPPGLFASR